MLVCKCVSVQCHGLLHSEGHWVGVPTVGMWCRYREGSGAAFQFTSRASQHWLSSRSMFWAKRPNMW